MAQPKSMAQRFRRIVLFVMICPAIEMNRQESRVFQAYNDTREIALSVAAAPTTLGEELDPWGEPYRIIQSPEGRVVFSSGPNRTSPLSGFDDDDIHSNMPSLPMGRKERRLLVAFSLPVLWLLGSIVYLAVGLVQTNRY